MTVKFNTAGSTVFQLIGGGPQGTILGQTQYTVASNDVARDIDDNDRYKYCDDLTVLEFICLSGLLTDYDTWRNVPSDVGIEEQFLPPGSFNMQTTLDHITDWTAENKMLLNPTKSSFTIFSRSHENFTTRLLLNNQSIDRKSVFKLCGVYFTENLTWAENTNQICRRAYSRLPMLSKLKYAGVKTEDLLDIYCLFIRSITEYCAVAFHSGLTEQQCQQLENIQRTCLKICLGDNLPLWK